MLGRMPGWGDAMRLDDVDETFVRETLAAQPRIRALQVRARELCDTPEAPLGYYVTLVALREVLDLPRETTELEVWEGVVAALEALGHR